MNFFKRLKEVNDILQSNLSIKRRFTMNLYMKFCLALACGSIAVADCLHPWNVR